MGASLTKDSDDESTTTGSTKPEKIVNKNVETGSEDSKKKDEKEKAQLQLSTRDEDSVEEREATEEENDGDLAREEEEERPPFDPENYDPSQYGPILPNGEINWECPCLGGAAHGPCGTEFRAAFSCFHYSTDDPKGADCFPAFEGMHVCFSKYPDLYKSRGGDDEDEEDEVQFDDEELKIIDDETEEQQPKTETDAPEEDVPKSQPEEKKTKQSKPSPEAPKHREPLIPPRPRAAVL